VTMNISERGRYVNTGLGFLEIPRLSIVRKVKSFRFRVSTPAFRSEGG
jgi:hypothetical protein